MIFNFSNISGINRYRLYIFFITVFLTASPVLTEQSHKTPIKEIDNQIHNLNSEIKNISERIKELRSDSINLITEYNTQKIQLENPLPDIESSLSHAQNNLQKLQNEIKVNKQDSINVTNSYMQKKQVRSKNLAVIEKKIKTLSQNIELMKNDLKTLQQISKMTTDKNIIALKTDSIKTDSLIELFIRKTTVLDNQLQQLKKDSVTQHLILQSLLEQNRQKTSYYDSLFQISQKSVDQISQQLSEIRRNFNSLTTKTQDELKILTSQKIKLASFYIQQKIQFDKIRDERKQLIMKLKALKKQYNNKRDPFVKQLRESDSLIKLRIRQKELWTIMKEKYTLDSTMIETRNELDKQIQLSAKGERSAKKKVQEIERDLHSLSGKQNTFLCRPGVKHADSELASLTLSQKKKQINKYLTSINSDLDRLSDIKKQNELKLSEYDKKMPLNSNPSLQKYRNINDTYKNKKSLLISLKHQKDSIDNIIVLKQNAFNELKTKSKREIQAIESKLAAVTLQRDQLDSQFEQITINSNLKKKKGKLTHISTQIRSTINDKTQSQQELARLKSHKKQLVIDISTAFDNLELKKQKAFRDLMTLNDMIAAKKSELDSLSQKRNKFLENDKNAYTYYRTKLTKLVNMHNSTIDSIIRLKTEIQTLQSRSSDLALTVTESEKRVANNLSNIKNRLELLYKQISEKKAAIKVLSKNRTTAFEAQTDDCGQVLMHSSTKSNQSIRQNKPEPKHTEIQYNKKNSQKDNRINTSRIESESSPHFGSVHAYDSLITAKENELAQLKASRENIYIQNMKKQKKYKEKSQSPKLSNTNTTTVKTQQNSKEIESTNNIIEEIYILLGEGRPGDAGKLFSSNKTFLQKHAAPEAIKMLEAAISSR